MPTRHLYTGQCQCGSVRYRLQGRSSALFACHCTECQRQSSSAFGMALWLEGVDDAGLAVLSDPALKTWVRQTPTGRQMACYFCQHCGTRLFHRTLGATALSVKPGTLDDARRLEPVAHIWTASKHPWVQIPDLHLQYDSNPPSFDAIRDLWTALHS